MAAAAEVGSEDGGVTGNAALFECPDILEEYIPIRVNTTYQETVAREDLQSVQEVLKIGIGAARTHRVLVEGEDVVAYNTIPVKWRIIPEPEKHCYQFLFKYPPHVFIDADTVARIITTSIGKFDTKRTGTGADPHDHYPTLTVVMYMFPHRVVTQMQTYYFDAPPRFIVTNSTNARLGEHGEGEVQRRKRPNTDNGVVDLSARPAKIPRQSGAFAAPVAATVPLSQMTTYGGGGGEHARHHHQPHH